MPRKRLAGLISPIGLCAIIHLTYATEPIATSDSEVPGAHLEIQELKLVSGGALTLRFTVFNDSDTSSRVLGSIGSTEAWTADGVYLIDVAGKKKYLVVRDAENRCVCSRGLDNMAAKSSTKLWAKFPAPPDSVQKIGIVVPHFIPIDDVPISR
jgi:hypothetical protein